MFRHNKCTPVTISEESKSSFDKYYKMDSSVSTEHADQTHPTEECYKIHLNDKVENALNSL